MIVSAAECGPERESIAVSVSNPGPQIAARHLDRIFDRLYQIRKTDTTVEGGLGLGLYICKQIVLAHGGDIRVENLESTGVRFTFTLKKAQSDSIAHAEAKLEQARS